MHFLLWILGLSFGLILDDPPTDTGGGEEPERSVDRAMDYVAEHPLFGEEEAPAKPGEEPQKPGEPKPGEPKPGAEPAAPLKPGEPKPGEPKAADAAAAEPAKLGAEIKYTISDKPVATLAEIEKLPYFNDATFQQLFTEHRDLSIITNDFKKLFSEGRYQIDGADNLKGVLEDSFTLYDIGELKTSPATLMERFKANYPEANTKAVFTRLAQWLGENGYKAEDVGKANDPTVLRLAAIERDNADRTRREKERDVNAENEAAYNALDKHVQEFGAKNKVEADDVLDYMTHIVSRIGGQKAEQDALRAGKFATVDRMLTEYHNRQLERQERWKQSLINAKDDREKKLPKVPPTGGAPPSGAKPPERPRVDLSDPEARRAEALRQFKTGGS